MSKFLSDIDNVDNDPDKHGNISLLVICRSMKKQVKRYCRLNRIIINYGDLCMLEEVRLLSPSQISGQLQ